MLTQTILYNIIYTEQMFELLNREGSRKASGYDRKEKSNRNGYVTN